jgi:predicted glycoside hydrolase/deacetylase ChbG (UPF0249 family)
LPRYLIINADDLGRPAGTVEGIGTLFEAGVVTSTSAMVNQDDWPQAAAMLRAHPDWDAGVHLVMSADRPILPPEQIPSLVDRRGYFRSGRGLLLRYPFISHAQLKAEWRAQIERFIADTGRQPSHIDLHSRYPYFFPAWFRISLELAEAYGRLAVRSPFDDALEERIEELSAGYGGMPKGFILRQGRRYRAMIRERGLPHTNYWESSFSQQGPSTAEKLLDVLDHLREGSTEILCHPGTEGWREKELQALLDPRVQERLSSPDIQLIGYRTLV